MAGPRQRKKARSSKPKVKTGTAGRTKAGKKKVNFLGNETIAKNWDRKLTLVQNYERLGLSVRLNAPTGGTEKKSKTVRKQDPLTIQPGAKPNQLALGEVQVERDPETGRILRIIQADNLRKRDNPLDDPLNDIMETDSDDEDDANTTALLHKSSNTNEIVKQLEAQAAAETEEFERRKKPRDQSAREEDWIEALIEKHGDDYLAMFRDRKLNVMQQSEGDIKRRVKKWRMKHG